MTNIAIFASGSGSNAEKIIEYFKDNALVNVKLILANTPKAFVLERAKKFNIESFVFNRDQFYNSSIIVDKLASLDINYIVLAGFLWLVPENLIAAYPDKIVNIHPALLPKYGGKGMYGDNVHKAVVAAKEKETGITIHMVNEKYDEGSIIFQAKCPVLPDDTFEDVASRIHVLEHKHFPEVIEKMISQA